MSCNICQNPAKYTCPACGTQTCSLDCVKVHKSKTQCTGVASTTDYISKKELSENSIHINRDYNFLLRFGRDIELGKGDVKSSAKNVFKRLYNGGGNLKRFKPNEQNDLRLLAVSKAFPNDPPTSVKRNNTLVIQLPPGMSRSSSNKSGYDKKTASFNWTVEWVLVDENGKEVKTFTSFKLKEKLVLKDAVPMNILKSSMEDIDKASLRFYLDNVLKKGKIIALDSEFTIADNLKDRVVLEFPKIYIMVKEGVWAEHVDESSDSESSESETSNSETSESDSSESDNDSDDEPEETSAKEPEVREFDQGDVSA